MSKNFVVNSVSLKSVFAENEEHLALYSQLDRTSDHCHCHIARASWDSVTEEVRRERV